MDDHAAIECYDAAGERCRKGFLAVRWPDVALEKENLIRLAEGVLGARFDFGRLAFGDDFDSATCGDRLSEAWRTDAVQIRFAPEGVFIRATFSVQIAIVPDEDDPDEPTSEETMVVDAELCTSFTHRHHTRPFVDFMSGRVRRISDGAEQRLDPFAHEIAPADAVAWGLNGT